MVSIEFKTDAANNDIGWRLTWGEENFNSLMKNLLSTGLVRDGWRRSGILMSPNFPKPYPNRISSDDIIRVSPYNTIKFNFTNFSTHSGQWTEDWVQIWEYISDNEGWPVWGRWGVGPWGGDVTPRLSGNSLPEGVSSPHHIARVRFVSDGLLVGAGWRLEWIEGRMTNRTGTKITRKSTPHLHCFQRAGPVMRAVNSTLWLRSCPASTSTRRTRAFHTTLERISASMGSLMDRTLATLATTSATQVTLLLQILKGHGFVTILGLPSTLVSRFLSRRLFCSTGGSAATAGQGILRSVPPTAFQSLKATCSTGGTQSPISLDQESQGNKSRKRICGDGTTLTNERRSALVGEDTSSFKLKRQPNR